MLIICYCNTGADDLDGDEEEEEEGWGFVQAPFLPPPPSQPDEVEHWARAMFTDGNALAGAVGIAAPGQGLPLTGIGLPRGLSGAAGPGQGNQALGRAGSSGVTLGSSPSYGGMVPMERIRSLFGR